MSVIFIPVYIKFMGIESYGIVGVFGSLLALFSVLDFGLGATMTREMARLSVTDASGRQARVLARTLETIYWTVALCLGAAVVLLAGPIANHWVKPGQLSPHEVKQALMIAGAVVALRWPVSFYAGGLRGLDQQPILNLIQSVIATVRGVGAVVVLWAIAPTIQAFFTWQIVVSGLEVSGLAGALWRWLPGSGFFATFSFDHLKQVWRFSAGMTAIGLVTLLLTQTDKIILSKMLTLEQFGYYSLAWTVSAIILRLIDPINAAVYPTLTRLVAQRDESRLIEVYHKSCQTEVVLLVPAALTLALFSDVVLTVWSSDAQLASNTGPVLSILVIGTCLNGFMHVPYLAQLAHGWTSLAFGQNLVSVVVLVPLMVVFTHYFQGIGAAWVWVMLNSGYVLIAVHIMHRHILKSAKWDWYRNDIAAPTVAALAVVLIAKVMVPAGWPVLLLTGYVLVTAVLACLAAILVTEFPRAKVLAGYRLLQERAATKTW